MSLPTAKLVIETKLPNDELVSNKDTTSKERLRCEQTMMSTPLSISEFVLLLLRCLGILLT
ncbi:hypothetical protein DEO72_LG10g2513 [Vigna unguiculata]|uniref:Uncharacterized protein n=1 Tax=Vigna unguiculata TaxID=3917 RepID=A0A4D6NBK9_VIGUN|nr:hypothetical protein DEO72_LG10g2513 [Vigna unguiculata]